MGKGIAFFIGSDKPLSVKAGERLREAACKFDFSCFTLGGDDPPLRADDICFIAAVGGDGTVLKAVPYAISYDVPILGINAGRVGFLSEILPEGFTKALEMYSRGELTVEERMMLSCTLNGEKKCICLNDMILYKQSFSGVARISFSISGDDAGAMDCDGIIIATPTGATGYSLSAGGPIIAMGLDAIAITPVCSHTLRARPIVAGADAELSFRMYSEGCLYSDGQLIANVGGDDEIVISRAQEKARFLRIGSHNLFSLVSEKLI